MDTPFYLWAAFFATVVLLLVFDLGLWHRDESEISVKESLKVSACYFLVAMLFGLYVMFFIERQAGNNFFTGYFVEESLSMDNIFVISMVFAHFAIPRAYQHRVLFWGILGAVLMRALMIFAGTALISVFHPALYLFGIFLLVTGARTLFFREEEKKTMEENRLLRWVRKIIPVSGKLHGTAFFIERADTKTASGKRWVATPLLLALMSVEVADIVFAVDSVPAVLAITTDPFIVYTSNIFAILGLRALYFALSAVLHRFEYMKYSLSLVLIFIGGKIFLHRVLEISSGVSLLVTLTLLAGGVLVSLYKTRK